MSEQRVQTYDLDLAAWSAISDADRETARGCSA